MNAPFFSQSSTIALDPIMAIDELFRSDPVSDKINLVVGVYQNEEGKTPVLSCVKDAERDLLEIEASKAYLPMTGEPIFTDAAEHLILGAESHCVDEHYVVSIQTPGSTGALRIAAELVKEQLVGATVWMSTPVYSNHKPIFHAAGLLTQNYRYFDQRQGTLVFDDLLADLSAARAGDVVLLHACCHNPSGADLSVRQWQHLATVMTERGLLPLIDAAYLGFGAGIEEDAAGLRSMAAICPQTVVASSFSKNFALYSERVGLLSLVTEKAASTQSFLEGAKIHVRRLYTSPPSHGAKVVGHILTNPSLRARWSAELGDMQKKLKTVRRSFAEGLRKRGVDDNIFPSIRQNHGMFALSQLSRAQINALREQHHIYMLDTGRISFGGMREAHIPLLVSAIAEVTR